MLIPTTTPSAGSTGLVSSFFGQGKKKGAPCFWEFLLCFKQGALPWILEAQKGTRTQDCAVAKGAFKTPWAWLRWEWRPLLPYSVIESSRVGECIEFLLR